jgi:hypothetical protein
VYNGGRGFPALVLLDPALIEENENQQENSKE